MKTIKLIIVVVLCTIINLSIGTTYVGKTAYAALIFSEYVEGSSWNKALEIYNSGTTSVALGDFSVDIYFNGSTTSTGNISLTPGYLSPGDVYVLANSDADDLITDLADQTSGALDFNGDDAITLYDNEELELVDSIGQIGVDPGDYWGSGSVTPQNHTLSRKISIIVGDTNAFDTFDPEDEWNAFPQDYFDGLGASPVPIPGAVWLLGSGLIGMVGVRRKFRK